MTVLQIVSLIYFLFVCIHLNAAGIAGVLLGAVGLYAAFTNQSSLVALVLIGIIAFHAVVKGMFTDQWKTERHRYRSFLHIGLSFVLLVFHAKALGYF